MPRLPRLQYPDAIYHVLTRGDGRQQLFHDDRHYERFTQGLVDEVDRSGWVVLAYCWMPNHIHALIKTPQPNLSNGMQHWLSGYANWYAKRNRRTGHLYQGRYKAFLVEDEGYYWNLSRYIHLTPATGVSPWRLGPKPIPTAATEAMRARVAAKTGLPTRSITGTGWPETAAATRQPLTASSLNRLWLVQWNLRSTG